MQRHTDQEAVKLGRDVEFTWNCLELVQRIHMHADGITNEIRCMRLAQTKKRAEAVCKQSCKIPYRYYIKPNEHASNLFSSSKTKERRLFPS